MSTMTWVDTLTETFESVTQEQLSTPFNGGEDLHHMFCAYCDRNVAVCGVSIHDDDGWVDCDDDDDGVNCIVCESMNYCPKCGRSLDEEVDDEVETPS